MVLALRRSMTRGVLIERASRRTEAPEEGESEGLGHPGCLGFRRRRVARSAAGMAVLDERVRRNAPENHLLQRLQHRGLRRVHGESYWFGGTVLLREGRDTRLRCLHLAGSEKVLTGARCAGFVRRRDVPVLGRRILVVVPRCAPGDKSVSDGLRVQVMSCSRKDRTVGGFIQTGATGFATGAAVSVGSSRLWGGGSFGPTSGRHVMLPEPSGRHVFVPEHAVRGSTAACNTITSEAIDRSAGAGGAVLNDVLTGKDPGDYMKDAINGAVSGAGGPTDGLHAR